MRSESTESTIPLRRARTTAPESRAVTPSIPVPTMGASARNNGTDWRCMLAPMSARLASSCSRKGTSDAATETSCLALTSLKSPSPRLTSTKLPALLAFLTGGEVEGMRLSLDLALAALFQVGVCLLDLVLFNDVAHAVVAITAVDDGHKVEHAPGLHLAVRRLDKAVVVNARIAAQRR